MRAAALLLAAAFAAGVAATGIAEVALIHHVLGWHHFVDSPDHAEALRSDGLFVAGMTALLVPALVVFAAAWPRARVGWQRLLGAFLGGSAFLNLADAAIVHGLLRLHVMRAGDDAWLVEAVWVFANLLLALLALRLVRRGRVPGAATGRARR
ncbi:MAG TPA: DUF2243 domain-containing protein [Candidatus Thermoplasmatota archaeon]|nr:DUF2243 domain-containing protein [Candidatus Thermoplasmatota archaeon]